MVAGAEHDEQPWLGRCGPGSVQRDKFRHGPLRCPHCSGCAVRCLQSRLCDLIWALALLPALKLLRAVGTGNVFWFVFAWGAAAGVAAAAGLLQARVAPKLSGSWAWLSHHRDLGFRYVTENTSNSLASQLRTSGLGVIAGLAAVAYVQAAATLLGPVMVVFMGSPLSGSLMPPEFFVVRLGAC